MTVIFDGRRFVIEEDLPEVGVYLYVFEGDKCVEDVLQNDIATCIMVALEDYGVPKELWIKRDSATDSTPRAGNT